MMKCEICLKEFATYRGLNGHKRLHGESKGTYSTSRAKDAPKTKILPCNFCGKDKHCALHHKGPVYCNNQCQGDKKISDTWKAVEAGTASSRSVKNYLIAKLGNVCQSPNCAWDNTKTKVNVELEHIDGNSDNNQLSNCTLLCPNCHSLTPTYGARNIGNGRLKRREKALASYQRARDIGHMLEGRRSPS